MRLWLRLRVKFLMQLRLLPYYIASQLVENEQKFIIGLGLLCHLNFVTVIVCDMFINLPVFDLKFVADAAIRYGSRSGSTKLMRLSLRLRLRNTGNNTFNYYNIFKLVIKSFFSYLSFIKILLGKNIYVIFPANITLKTCLRISCSRDVCLHLFRDMNRDYSRYTDTPT
jgi:hypothetical protein